MSTTSSSKATPSKTCAECKQRMSNVEPHPTCDRCKQRMGAQLCSPDDRCQHCAETSVSDWCLLLQNRKAHASRAARKALEGAVGSPDKNLTLNRMLGSDNVETLQAPTPNLATIRLTGQQAVQFASYLAMQEAATAAAACTDKLEVATLNLAGTSDDELQFVKVTQDDSMRRTSHATPRTSSKPCATVTSKHRRSLSAEAKRVRLSLSKKVDKLKKPTTIRTSAVLHATPDDTFDNALASGDKPCLSTQTSPHSNKGDDEPPPLTREQPNEQVEVACNSPTHSVELTQVTRDPVTDHTDSESDASEAMDVSHESVELYSDDYDSNEDSDFDPNDVNDTDSVESEQDRPSHRVKFLPLRQKPNIASPVKHNRPHTRDYAGRTKIRPPRLTEYISESDSECLALDEESVASILPDDLQFTELLQVIQKHSKCEIAPLRTPGGTFDLRIGAQKEAPPRSAPRLALTTSIAISNFIETKLADFKDKTTQGKCKWNKVSQSKKFEVRNHAYQTSDEILPVQSLKPASRDVNWLPRTHKSSDIPLSEHDSRQLEEWTRKGLKIMSFQDHTVQALQNVLKEGDPQNMAAPLFNTLTVSMTDALKIQSEVLIGLVGLRRDAVLQNSLLDPEEALALRTAPVLNETELFPLDAVKALSLRFKERVKEKFLEQATRPKPHAQHAKRQMRGGKRSHSTARARSEPQRDTPAKRPRTSGGRGNNNNRGGNRGGGPARKGKGRGKKPSK